MQDESSQYYVTKPERERALLVGVDFDSNEWPLEDSLQELERLVETDGADVEATVTQKLSRPLASTFVGKGKAEEIVTLCKNLDIDVVVFDDELSPSQQSNLEKICGKKIKVIDRTALILDIFAKHASTKEGVLQVQLAQMRYLYPRLRGMWSSLLSNQTRGGIGGMFGAGESQLEIDRRQVRDKISKLRKELKQLDKRRSVRNKARVQSGIYRVALAGYTNAGKSTLLNCITGSDVYAKDELFATLDPTTRSFELEEGRKICLTDTVGFIQKLPTTLVEAFNSTLSEVRNADLILKVVDVTDKNRDKQLKAVDDVLEQIGAQDINSVVVYNKCDELDPATQQMLAAVHPDAIFISALEHKGIEGLLHKISQEASAGDSVLTCLIPFDKGQIVGIIHNRCQIISEHYCETGLMTTIRVPKDLVPQLKPYEVQE